MDPAYGFHYTGGQYVGNIFERMEWRIQENQDYFYCRNFDHYPIRYFSWIRKLFKITEDIFRKLTPGIASYHPAYTLRSLYHLFHAFLILSYKNSYLLSRYRRFCI